MVSSYFSYTLLSDVQKRSISDNPSKSKFAGLEQLRYLNLKCKTQSGNTHEAQVVLAALYTTNITSVEIGCQYQRFL